MSRAIRRHHRARIKNNRKNYWGYGISYLRENESMSSRIAGMVVGTPHPCSCYMCGNQTKHHGKRFQWLKSLEHSDIQED